MTKIWHQSVNELDKLGAYRTALEQLAALSLSPGSTISINGLAQGAYDGMSPTEALGNAESYHRVLSQIIDLARTAEKGGFDAFVIGSFSEPFLREIRTTVDIPVVSMTEAALLTACTLGGKTALITNAPSVRYMVEMSVEKHKLHNRVLDVVALDPPQDEFALEAAYADPSELAEHFRATALTLIARGADTIIPAEGVLARLIGMAGLTQVGNAPVLDVFSIAWAQAEMHDRLWKATGLRRGREWSYRQ
ncbi:aspartate/glutamate racemase family protein [Vreelandella titanicae]|uniref:aspartate/glutamate racemase family protein n=1 Tax=Vreelandella titanicae TaxID=664683 RepID=UPI00315A7E3A